MEKIITNQVICSSDRNLKENIQELPASDPSVIGKATNIKVKSFNFKDDDLKNKMYGVIAQDVQDAGLGELVYKKEDETLAVDYTSLMILKIMALEERFHSLSMSFIPLNDMVMGFEERLKSLEEKIEKLENK